MFLLLRIVLSNLAVRRARTLLTIAAIALSVSLVVSVTSGYNSIEVAARKYVNKFLGGIDASIYRADDPAPGVPQDIVAQLRDDPDVAGVCARLGTDLPLPPTDTPSLLGNALELNGVDVAHDLTYRSMTLLNGRWFEDGEAGAVINTATADRLKLKIGDKLDLTGKAGKLSLPIVGTVKTTSVFGGKPAAYLPLRQMQKFVYGDDNPARVSLIRIEFATRVDADAFASRWREKLQKADKLLTLKLERDTREELDKKLIGMRLLSLLGGTVSMLAATFIVFSTLSMGVAERQRVLAMIRAIGGERQQVGMLVIIEGIILSTAGVLVGVPLGWAWVEMLAAIYSDFFTDGVTLDWIGIALAGGGSLLAAVVASGMPALRAMRVSPLEAMSPLGQPGATQIPWRSMLVGLLLIAVDPAILFLPFDRWASALGLPNVALYADTIRFYSHFVPGLPALLIGFFLLSPAIIYAVERLAGPVVARVMGVRYALLRQQLSGGVWRSAGTCAALMVGLAVLVVMQTQGRSALASWQLPDKFPDVFIYTGGLGSFSPEAQEQIRTAPELVPGDTMAIGIFNPSLPNFGLLATQFPRATTFVAAEPDKVFRLMQLDFREGSPDEATRMLKLGRHVVITQEFQKLKGYHVGDPFKIESRLKGELTYTVAGVVWSPGFDVMVNTLDLGRQFEQQSAATVFGTLADAKNDFGVESVPMMAANLNQPIEKDELAKKLQDRIGSSGVGVADVRLLKYQILQGFSKLINLASTVAWAAMAVASLGVVNTLVASVRSRRWQFGVLRSIGVERGMLLRLILCEGLLIGVIASLLGLLAGLLMAIDAMRLSRIVVGFDAPIRVPWSIVGLGVGAVVLISLLASLFPAWRTSRTEPLSLLQAGRAAA